MTRVRGGARGAVGVLVLLLAMASALVTAGVPRRAEAADRPPVEVVVNSISTPVLRPEDVMTLGVQIVNNTRRDLDDVTVKVRIGTELEFRDDLSADGSATRDVSEKTATVRVAKVPAGAREARELKVSADKLGLPDDDNAVYALNVDAVDDGSRAATARLLVPWIAKATPGLAKTQVGVLWPLIDKPRRDGTTIGDQGQTPVFLDDGLNSELTGAGRLNALVATGSTIPNVTWVVDPDLLGTADAMTRDYRVAPPKTPESASAADADANADGDGKSADQKSDTETAKAAPRTEEETEPGTGGQAAAAWLDQLRRETSGDTVVALPYADTDLAVIAHSAAGMKGDLAGQLRDASARGQATTQSLLGRPARADVAWPVAGALDNPILDTAKANGASLVVASGASLPPRNPKLTYTPSTRVEVGEKTDALVTDQRIDTLLAGGADSPERRIEIQQALIAELFTIAMEEPQRQRSLLIAPPRTMDDALGQAIAGALKAASETNGWSDIVPLETLAQSVRGDERTIKPYPQDLRRTEPSERYLKSVEQLQSSVDVFAGILTRPERITEPYAPAVLRALSTSWRGAAGDADAYRLDVTRSLRVLQQLVRIVPKTGVTLSGEKGQVPITVINGLQQAIKVRLGVDSRQPNRLELTPEEERTIPAGHTSAIPIDAKSAANGKVLVDVRLMTPDGRAFGPTQTFWVNTTSIDGITLGIIGVIAGLLALFSLRAYLRRRRTAAAGEDGSGTDAGGDGGAGPTADGSGTHTGNEGGTTRHGSRDRPDDHHAPA